MLCLAFGKKSRIEDQIKNRRSLKRVNMRVQASLLASVALTAEVDVLKRTSSGPSKSSDVPRRSSRTMKVRNTLFKLNICIYKKVQLQKMTGVSWLL